MSLEVATLTGGSNSYPTPSKYGQFYIGDVLKQGAIQGDAFFVEAQSSPNMTVKVNSGSFILSATPTSEAARLFRAILSADSNVTISANSSGSTKYDLVYIKLVAATLQNPPLTGDFTEAATLLTERHNTSGEALTDSNGIVLAEVAVSNGAVTITNANITDRREFVQDGWSPANETWTYASATTFTVAGDVRTKYSIGDKIKLTQTTVKYFYVRSLSYSAGVTTITVTAGTDYSLANAAITLPFFSKASSPVAFPRSFNFDPAPTGYSAVPTGVNAKFSIDGNMCSFWYYASTDGTSNTTSKGYSLPINSAAGSGSIGLVVAQVKDNGTSAYGKHVIDYNSAVVTCFPTISGPTWTNSGVCNHVQGGVFISYPI